MLLDSEIPPHQFELKRLFTAYIKGQFRGDEKAADKCRKAGIEIRAQSGNINTAGAFLVPEQFGKLIESSRDEAGVLRREIAVRPMASDSQQVPLRGDSSEPYFTPENAPTGEGDMSFGSAMLHAQKLSALVRYSSELVEDQAGDGGYVSREMGGKFAAKVDDCGFNGDGSSAYGGMLGVCKILADGAHAGGVVAGAGHDNHKTVTDDDLGALIGTAQEQTLESSKFYISAYGLGNTFIRLGATAYGFENTPGGKRPLFQYGGFPIVVTSKLPKSGSHTGKMMIGFGDVRASAVLGERRGITVKASWQRYLEKDQIAFKGTQRFTIAWHNLGDANKAGGFVGLLGG